MPDRAKLAAEPRASTNPKTEVDFAVLITSAYLSPETRVCARRRDARTNAFGRLAAQWAQGAVEPLQLVEH